MEEAKRRPYRGGTASQNDEKCAWVVLVMIGSAYIPGALVTATSLKFRKTKYPVICMVTADVPEEGRVQLATVFDRVVEVDTISYPSRPMPTEKQADMYAAWIAQSYTKWAALTLDEYTKVILLDADMLFLTNCDGLFSLPAPAACYSFSWAPPWGKGDMVNPYAADGVLAHGVAIPAETVLVDAPATTDKTFVGGASIILLAPDPVMYAKLLLLLSSAPVYAAGRTCVNGVDEISIAEVYAARGTAWTHIHQQYTAIPWKKKWVSRDIRALHFHGRKPWLMNPAEWPDLADWWKTAEEAVVRYPTLSNVFPALAKPAPASAPQFAKVPASQLDVTAAELRLTRDIIARLTVKRPGQESRQRARCALIAWFQAIRAVPSAPMSWSAVHRVTLVGDESSDALATALVQADLARPQDTSEIVKAAIGLITSRLSSMPPRQAEVISYGAESASYGSFFTTPVTPQIRHAVGLAGEKTTIASLMRHEAALAATPQYQGLYEGDYRFEVFASPFGRLFFDHADATYCSPFHQLDAPLGSLGDFFEITAPGKELPAGHWVVHPTPAGDMVAAARRIAEVLARPGPELRVAFIADTNKDTNRAFRSSYEVFRQEVAPLQAAGVVELLLGIRGCIACRLPQ